MIRDRRTQSEIASSSSARGKPTGKLFIPSVEQAATCLPSAVFTTWKRGAFMGEGMAVNLDLKKWRYMRESNPLAIDYASVRFYWDDY